MNQPLEIVFRHAERSPAVERAVREQAEALHRLCDQLQHCRVVVEIINRHLPKGHKFRTRLDLKLRGKTIVVGRSSAAFPGHADVYQSVRHAFDAAARRLQDFARRRRHEVKTHDAPPHGRVERLFPGDGYGFVRLSDGQEVYFHQHSVVGAAFKALAVGDEVRVTVHEGESAKGPQAGSVRPVGRHHIVAPVKRT